MNIIDIVVAAVLLIGFILGYKDGLVRKIIGLIGFILAIVISSLYASAVGKFIYESLGIELYLAEIIGGLIIFILIILVFSILKRVIHPFDKVNNWVNQILGGAVGVIQILFFLSAVFFLLNVFDVPSKQSRKTSYLYTPVYNVLPKTIDYIASYTPRTKQILKDYINEKDSI